MYLAIACLEAPLPNDEFAIIPLVAISLYDGILVVSWLLSLDFQRGCPTEQSSYLTNQILLIANQNNTKWVGDGDRTLPT